MQLCYSHMIDLFFLREMYVCGILLSIKHGKPHRSCRCLHVANTWISAWRLFFSSLPVTSHAYKGSHSPNFCRHRGACLVCTLSNKSAAVCTIPCLQPLVYYFDMAYSNVWPCASLHSWCFSSILFLLEFELFPL